MNATSCALEDPAGCIAAGSASKGAQIMIGRSSFTRVSLLTIVVGVLGVSAFGCGGSNGGNASASTSAGATGTWAGTYSGSFSGSFTLTWQGSGSSLSGTIKISDFGDSPIPINGSLHGNTISFGTVGSQAITYDGSVSGASMSGSWKIVASGKTAGNGSWKATKS
jgi:hypothetical protein